LALVHNRHPGPGFIFFFAGLLLIILSTVDLALTFIKQSGIEKHKEQYHMWSGVRWQKILLVLGCLSAYAIFLDSAGFFLISFFLMIFLFKAIEPTKWWITILGSFITTATAYTIFKLWLEVPRLHTPVVYMNRTEINKYINEMLPKVGAVTEKLRAEEEKGIK
jgi:hypothetical protein